MVYTPRKATTKSRNFYIIKEVDFNYLYALLCFTERCQQDDFESLNETIDVYPLLK